MRIFFDVMGTLLSVPDERTIRPGAAALIEELSEEHEVTLWSSAGAAFTREFARRFGLLAWVEECIHKTHLPVPPDICVDDVPACLVGRKGNVLVTAYEGSENDREMERVREAIRSIVLLHETGTR